MKTIGKIRLLKISPTFDQKLSPCTLILYERYIIFLCQLVEEGSIDQPSIRVIHSSQVGSMYSPLMLSDFCGSSYNGVQNDLKEFVEELVYIQTKYQIIQIYFQSKSNIGCRKIVLHLDHPLSGIYKKRPISK